MDFLTMAYSDKPVWFAARTRNGQWKKISLRLAQLGIRCYIPPVYRTMVFLFTTKAQALSLVNSGEMNARFIIDHNTRTLLEVPEKQMEDFIRVLDLSPDAECLTDATFVRGDKVRVAKGPLSGVEGEIVEDPDGASLIVRVRSLLCAKVRIPKNFVIPAAERVKS